MKILKSLIYFIIIMIAVSCSPTKKICDKWELNNGIVIFQFNENNSFEVKSLTDSFSWKWELKDHYLKYITNDSTDNIDTFLVESLSKNKLILTDSANPKFTIHLKSYKPLNRNCNVEEIKNFLISNTLLYKSRIHKRPFLKKRIEFLDNGKCILNDFYNYMYDWKVVEFEGNYFVIIDYWFEQEIYKITNIKKNRLNFIGNLKSNNYSFKCSFVKEKIRDNIIDENQLIGNWSVVTDSLIILNYPDNSIFQLKKKYQKKIEKGKKYRDEEIIVFDESEIEEELDGVLNTQDYDTIVDEEIVLYSQNCDTIVEEDIVLNTHLNEPPPPPPPLQDSTVQVIEYIYPPKLSFSSDSFIFNYEIKSWKGNWSLNKSGRIIFLDVEDKEIRKLAYIFLFQNEIYLLMEIPTWRAMDSRERFIFKKN